MSAVSPDEPPSTSLDKNVLKLTYAGKSFALTENRVYLPDGSGTTVTLQFNEPMESGYNQIWLSTPQATKGKAAKIEGMGMSTAFIQLAKTKQDVHNVSSNCSTTGSVTYRDALKAGAKTSGEIDVTITCSKVTDLTGPLRIKGSFDALDVVKESGL